MAFAAAFFVEAVFFVGAAAFFVDAAFFVGVAVFFVEARPFFVEEVLATSRLRAPLLFFAAFAVTARAAVRFAMVRFSVAVRLRRALTF